MVWVALHNHRVEPVSINAGHRAGTLEAAGVVEPQGDAAGAGPLSLSELVPNRSSPVQQRQLTQLLEFYRDIFSLDDEDIRQNSVLEHTIETAKDAHPLPRITDLLDAIHATCWFSTLD